MTLPVSGPISMYQVRDEMWLQQYGDQIHTWSVGLSQARDLAGVPSGPISLANLRGKGSSGALSGSATGSTVSGQSSTINSTNWSGNATANPTGGSGGYTYSWTISGPGTLTSATSQTCSVSRTAIKNGTLSGTTTATCVIRDSAGTTVTVSANITWDVYNNM